MKEISQNLDLRFEIDKAQNETKKQLYKEGYKTISFSLPNRYEIINFDFDPVSKIVKVKINKNVSINLDIIY